LRGSIKSEFIFTARLLESDADIKLYANIS